MTKKEQELYKAAEFVRKTFADKNIQLDYSTNSVKYLDDLFEQEFKNGRLKRPESSFAKFQGLIMIGISGYLADIILKHTPVTQLVIDDNDPNWYLNFSITDDNNRTTQPGKIILSRIQDGNKSSLVQYILYAVNYFGGKIDPITAIPNKPWWKFW